MAVEAEAYLAGHRHRWRGPGLWQIEQRGPRSLWHISVDWGLMMEFGLGQCGWVLKVSES